MLSSYYFLQVILFLRKHKVFFKRYLSLDCCNSWTAFQLVFWWSICGIAVAVKNFIREDFLRKSSVWHFQDFFPLKQKDLYSSVTSHQVDSHSQHTWASALIFSHGWPTSFLGQHVSKSIEISQLHYLWKAPVMQAGNVCGKDTYKDQTMFCHGYRDCR